MHLDGGVEVWTFQFYWPRLTIFQLFQYYGIFPGKINFLSIVDIFPIFVAWFIKFLPTAPYSINKGHFQLNLFVFLCCWRGSPSVIFMDLRWIINFLSFFLILTVLFDITNQSHLYRFLIFVYKARNFMRDFGLFSRILRRRFQISVSQ